MLQGKSALVTGSTRGIGMAIAAVLAAEGCNVMLNGFGDDEAIEAMREEMATTHGVGIAYHGADLAQEAEIDALTDATVEAFGAIDILINNAVIRYFHNIDELRRDRWRHALAVNVTAPFVLTQNVLPAMKSRGWGRIINFSSVLGLAARSGRADYVTSKTALLGLTRATAAETADIENITCNAICPGSVLTPNTEIKIAELAAAEGIDFNEAKLAYRSRRGQKLDYIAPERVARLIAFLCQDSSFDITGAAIPIDQGRSANWVEA